MRFKNFLRYGIRQKMLHRKLQNQFARIHLKLSGPLLAIVAADVHLLERQCIVSLSKKITQKPMFLIARDCNMFINSSFQSLERTYFRPMITAFAP